jgi:hypothetical protein
VHYLNQTNVGLFVCILILCHLLFFSLIYHTTPNIISTINDIEKLNGNNFPSWKNKLEIALGMLELDYALENDKPKLQLLELMNLMSLWRLTRRTVPLGRVLTECLSRL